MKVLIAFFKAPIKITRQAKQARVSQFKQQMLLLKSAFAQEKTETKEMLQIYQKYTLRQANKEEIRIANKQFIDLLKGLGLGIFVILPFAPITIPVMIKLARKVGVELLPSSFTTQDPTIKKP